MPAEPTPATESADHEGHRESLTSTTEAKDLAEAHITSTAGLEDYDDGVSHEYDYNTNYEEYVFTPVTEPAPDTEDHTSDTVNAADTTVHTPDTGMYTHDSVVHVPDTNVITHHTVVHTSDAVFEIVHNQDTIDTGEVVHTSKTDKVVHMPDTDEVVHSSVAVESDSGDTIANDYGDSSYDENSAEYDDYVAPVAVDNPVESSAQLLEASKLLLKKLAMLTMGDKTLAAFPNLLDQIFSQLGKGSRKTILLFASVVDPDPDPWIRSV